MKHFPFCLASALLALASCTGSTEPLAPAAASVIIPLTVGNTWIGRQLEFRPDTVRTRFDTIQVERDTVIDGERRSLFNFQNGYVNRSDGAYVWGLGTGGEPRLRFKYPATAGDEVRYAEATGQGNDSIWVSIKVLSTNEHVIVPAGTYSCYHYYSSSNWGQFDAHYYLAPGIGFVKFIAIEKETYQRLSDSSHWELLSVSLK